MSSTLIPSALLIAVYATSRLLLSAPALGPITSQLAWPPVGILLAAALLYGPKVWPGVVLSAFLELPLSGLPISHSLGTSLGIVVETLCAAWWLDRMRFRPELKRIRDVLHLLIGAVVGGALLGAAVKSAYQIAAGFRPLSEFVPYGFNHYRGDALAFLLVTPVLLTWARDPKFQWLRGRLREALVLLLTLFLSLVVVFTPWVITRPVNFPIRFVVLIIIVWAAMRFGPPGGTATTLITATFATLGLWSEEPATISSIGLTRLALLWGYAMVTSMTAMMIAAAVCEQQAARRQWALLMEANLALTRSLDLDTVLNTLLDSLAQLVPFDSGNVLLQEGDSLVLHAARGYERWTTEPVADVRIPAVGNPLWERVRTGSSVVVPDTREEPAWIVVPATSYVRNWLAVPLRAGGKVIGLYSLDKAEPGFFTEEHAQLAESLAAQAAVAIQNAQLFDLEERAQEALRASQEKFAAAFRSSPDPVSIATLDTGRLLDVNESFLRLFGLKRQETIGRTAVDLNIWPDPEVRGRMVEQLRQEGRLREFDAVLRNREGELRTCLLSAEIIHIAGQPCVLVVSRDVSERRRLEERFQKAFRSSPVAMLIASLPDLRYVDVNEAGLALVGFSREELVGRSELVSELGLGVEPEQAANLLGQFQQTGRVRNAECAFKTRSGETRQGLLSAESIDVDGRPHALISVLDVTEQRRLEERFQKAFRSSPLPMAITDVETTRYLDVNEGFLRMFAAARDHVIGHTAIELGLWVDPRDREVLREHLRQHGRVENFEARLRNTHGENLMVQIFAVQIEIGGQRCVLSVSRDVTEQRRAEQALWASEERFVKVFHSTPLSMTISTLDEGRYVDVNEGYTRLTGFTRDEAVGRTSGELQIWARPEKRLELISLLKQDGRVENFDFELRTKSGEIRQGMLNAVVIELGGNPHLLGATLDMTDYRRLEEQFRQAQKMEAIGRLAGGVAHDFNNLLMVIMGRADMLALKLPEGDEALHAAEEIQHAAQRAASLTRQLLTFSRKQTLQPRVLNLNVVVGELEKMLRRLIGEDVEFVFRPGPDLRNVKADPGGLEQILMNLCINARDAMPNGGRLTVSTSNIHFDDSFPLSQGTISPGAYVLLSVSDTGVGMDALTQGRIFEPFFTTKEVGKGTGLGLSTVYGNVQQSGGFISVYSEPGRGTTFKIYLPVAEAEPDQPVVTQQESISRGSETILLVEDEDAVRQLAADYLSTAGYVVLGATCSSEALELCRRNPAPIHLLLTDVILPGMSGWHLAQEVSALRPGIAVLYLSGYTSDVVAQHGLLPDGMPFIEKPFRLREFAARVRAALETSGVARARGG